MPVTSYLIERLGYMGATLHREHFETWRGLRPRRAGDGERSPIGKRDRPRRPSLAAAHLARQRKARAS